MDGLLGPLLHPESLGPILCPSAKCQFCRLPHPQAVLEPEERLHLLLAVDGPPKVLVEQVIFLHVDCLHRQVPRWRTLPKCWVCAMPLFGVDANAVLMT